MNKKLVLFTSSFPYEGGEQFLETEINYLSKEFEEVIIVPLKYHKNKRETPSNIKVVDDIGKSSRTYFKRVMSLFSKYFFFNIKLNIKYNKKLAIDMFYILKIKKWLEVYCNDENVEETVFYSYWFSAATSALSITKNKNKNIKYITRVHGGDLYEQIHGFDFFPFRKKVFENINKVYSISTDGKKHLINKYGDTDKIEISRLGVMQSKSLSKYSSDKVIRIASCSSLIPVKRVHIIIDALKLIEKQNIDIEWSHIGSGYLEKDIKEKVKMIFFEHVKVNFLGFMPNKNVYEFYKNNYIDLFVNVSASEGVPVSIMEAQSYRVPVAATNVGGNSEIVDDDNGKLLSVNNTAAELSEVILDIYKNQDKWLLKKEKSYENWNTKYKASENYNNFAQHLKEL